MPREASIMGLEMNKLLVIALVVWLLCACQSEPPPAGSIEITPTPAAGVIDHYRDLQHDGLLPRDILVWTPPGYAAEPARRYPVLYMHDAQMLFDATTTWNGQEWAVDESVARMIEAGEIEPLIVVGLANTGTRTADYSPGPRGEAYMDFLVNTVKPMIDARYRTRPGKASTLVAGSSMGGLISCMLGWRYPEVFGAALCFSPAFRMEGETDWSLFFTESGGDKRDVYFYVDNGGVGLEERLQPGIDYLLGFWKEQGYREGEDFVLVVDAEAEHKETAWAERFPAALKLGLANARVNDN
jgi:predicted alpha/beta superfamily hydrolase